MTWPDWPSLWTKAEDCARDWRLWVTSFVLVLSAYALLDGFREGIRQNHIILLQAQIAELRQHRCEEPVIEKVERAVDSDNPDDMGSELLSATEVIVTLGSVEEAERFVAWMTQVGGGDFHATIREPAPKAAESQP